MHTLYGYYDDKDPRSGGEIMLELIEEKFPELLKRTYPRVYENVSDYYSPKMVGAALAAQIAEALHYGDPHTFSTATQLMYPAMRPLIEHRVPMFFITRPLLEAIKQTGFAEAIDWLELKLPFEEGVFMIPKGSFGHPVDGDVACIIWSRKRNATYPGPLPGMQSISLGDTCFDIFGFCPRSKEAIWYDSHVTFDKRPLVKLGNLFWDDDRPMPSLPINTPRDAVLSKEDQPFLEQMAVICFGTLMAMNARPGLLQKEKHLRTIPAKKDRPQKEFWEPNYVGLHYRVQYVHGRSEPHGTHASPRMHWRRGHLRNQPCGPQRKEYKTIWIEPMLIGAVEETVVKS